MPTATALAMPHRTVLNTLNNSSGALGSVVVNGLGANALCGYPGVDLDVIYDLADGGYLTGPHRWAYTYGLEPNCPDYAEHIKCCVEEYRRHGDKMFRFHLTEKGRHWVRNDPLSVLLTLLWHKSKRRMNLHEVLGFSDRDTTRLAHDAGFVTVHYGGDGQEDPHLTDYEFRHARDFYLQGTLKVRDVLG